MNHPDLWDRQAPICFQSPESELNMEQQHSVTMGLIFGTNSLKIAGPLQHSPLLNLDLKHFFLPLLLTEAIQVFELHYDSDSTVLFLLKLFYSSLLVLMFVS